MRLRLLVAATAMLAFSLPSHADTFVFTPTGGTAITFSTDGITPTAETASPYNYLEYQLGGGPFVRFFGDSQAAAYQQYGSGHFDFEYFTFGAFYFEDGPQIFAGNMATSTPTFAAATYTLSPDPAGGINVGGTLLVNGGAPAATAPAAVTPEPSSLALLGTGLLGLAGAIRRRLA